MKALIKNLNKLLDATEQNPIEENYQTCCEYLCVVSHKETTGGTFQEGMLYYFHEDYPPPAKCFLPVVDPEGFPVTKTVRVVEEK